MKLRHIFTKVLFASIALSLPGCSTDKKPEPEYDISVSPESITLEATEYEGHFDVYSNAKWEITGCPSWIQLSTTSGSGNSYVTFLAEENNDANPWQGTITLRTTQGAVKTAWISVTRMPQSISATISKNTFEATGGSIIVRVAAPSLISWIVTAPSDDTWLHVGSSTASTTSSSHSGNGDITIYADENPTGDQRTSTITVAPSTTAPPVRLTVTQEGHAFSATMSTTNYVSSGDYWPINISAGSSQSWSVTRSDTWVHLNSSTSSSNTYYGTGSNSAFWIYVDANPSTYSRQSTITVTSGSSTTTITITQNGAAATLSITSPTTSTISFSADGGTQTVNVSSNESWTVTSDNSWCSVPSTRTAGNGSFTITVPRNTSTSSRTATVTVRSTSGLTVTRTVSQEPAASTRIGRNGYGSDKDLD